MTVLLRHLDVHELTGSAGGDPWELNKTIQSGSPGEISELATVQFQSDWNGPYIGPEDSKDWFYAMGGIQQSVTGVVTVHPPTEPGGEPTVTVDYQTHVFDRYNWDGNKTTTFDVPGTDGVTISDERMGALHTAGLAKEYNISGSGSVHHYEGALPSNAPLDLPSAPDNRDGTRSDPGRYGHSEYVPGRVAG
jgi:hypothetical protein